MRRFASVRLSSYQGVNYANGYVLADIRRFDAQSIPFEGPGGLMIRVEKLLDAAPPPRLQEREKLELLDRFIKVVLNISEDSR